MATRPAEMRPLGKRGPKKGWLDKLHTDLANYKDEAEYLREQYIHKVGQCNHYGLKVRDIQRRIDSFNAMPFWSKVLFLLKGGHV